jgi:hypothetical protein
MANAAMAYLISIGPKNPSKILKKPLNSPHVFKFS